MIDETYSNAKSPSNSKQKAGLTPIRNVISDLRKHHNHTYSNPNQSPKNAITSLLGANALDKSTDCIRARKSSTRPPSNPRYTSHGTPPVPPLVTHSPIIHNIR